MDDKSLSTSTSEPFQAKLLIAPTISAVGSVLSDLIIQSCHAALEVPLSNRNIFTIALSGGSLPTFLQRLPDAFAKANIDPQWDKWHVFLADERCVVSSHVDSNLGAIISNFITSEVPIPKSQIYGIDEALLFAPSSSSEAVAKSYQENVVQYLLDMSGDGMVDCAVLGFGPDGHTCSLFPNHKLLQEQTRLVASIDDSPKPPPSRITLTLTFLNNYCRRVIFCGAGASKGPIIKAIFTNVEKKSSVETNDQIIQVASVTLCTPAPFPCGMVRPQRDMNDALVWVVDEEAAKEIM